MKSAQKYGWMLCLCCGLLVGALRAQSPLDSTEQLLPTLTGRAKMSMAGELAYQYCFANTAKALQYGKMELELALQTGDSLAISQAWNDLGAVHASRGELQTSIDYTSQALRVRQRLGDSLLVANSCNKLGYAWLDMGVHDKALDAFLRAARIYEQAQKRIYLPGIYNNIGSVQLRQGNATKALEYLFKASTVAEQVGDNSSRISAKANIASIDFERGDYAAAREGYTELLDLIAATGIQQHLGTVRMNLGACLVRTGDYALGIQNLMLADSFYVAKDDAKGQAMTQVNLALGYLGQADTAAARKHLSRAQQFCEKVDSDQQWFHLYDGYYRLESAEGHLEEAVRYQALANEHRAKIYTDAASRQIAEMETKYETEKKERALAVAQLKNRNQLILIGCLAATLLLGGIVVVFMTRNQRLKRETLQQRSMMALQEERLRISRDLHDHIGAELTLISSSVEMAASHADPVLQDISGYARTAMSQLRETVWAIRTEAIPVDAFADRLRDYISRLCAPVKMAWTLDVQGDGDKVLSPTITLQLYRLCQEAIHNAVKYAQSPKLEVQIAIAAAQITVTITDHGIGFDPDKTQQGYGIGNMKARAAEQGGAVELQSEKGKGTVLVVKVPI
jgi:signal transduction histidine kinase/Tfp pilus assembly protein PilF